MADTESLTAPDCASAVSSVKAIQALWKRFEKNRQDFEDTRVNLGSGSCAVVRKFRKSDGSIYAGRIIHEDQWCSRTDPKLIDFEVRYAHDIDLMSQLDHPNIVKFLGLIFLPKRILPTILMERMELNLRHYLKGTEDLQLESKVSILADIACGMKYLHSKAIVHHDLTASNVLLSEDYKVAKITDFDTARIIGESDIKENILIKQRVHRGTLVYMPPEAMEKQTTCTTSVDIFSFGHLALFTATQVRHFIR